MPLTRGNIQFSGLEIVRSNFEDIEKTFYEVLFTETQWRKVIPINAVESNINEGANSTSYTVKGVTGQGAFRASYSGSMPVIGRSISKPTVIPLLIAGVMAKFSDDELRTYAFGYGGNNLTMDVPSELALASDRHVEVVVFYGDSAFGFESWMDYSNVTVQEAAKNAADTSRQWADKSADEKLKDINDGMQTIWLDSKMIHVPDHIWLPTDLYALIATDRIKELDMTTLEFFKKNNLYTTLTGNEVSIQPISHLTGAGTDANGRIVIEQHNEKNHKLPFSIPFRMRQPFQTIDGVDMAAEYKFGSYHNRYPGSMIYIDFPNVP